MIRPSLILAGLTALLMAVPASAAPPRLSSAVSADRDSDGHVDAVSVRFSGKVKGKGSFSVAGKSVTSVGKPRGRRVELRVAEGDGCDLGLLPRVSYRSGLKSARGRRLRARTVDMERRDRRGPRLSCAMTSDADGDGRVDGLVLTWSKKVRGGTAAAFAVDGFTVRGVSGGGSRNLTLRLAERGGMDSGVTPSVTYARVKNGGVRGRGGQALAGALQATRDGAAPVLASARTADSDSDGLVDTIYASFSEPVHSAASGLRVEGAGVTGSAPSADQLTLGLAEGSLGTGAQPHVTYAAGEITDDAGNTAPAGDLIASDGAGPVVTASRTADLNGDGRLDTILVTFSEPVSHSADSDGSYPLDVPGYALAGVSAANGATVEISLQQASGPDSGLKPSVRYARGIGDPVLDGAGNEALPATFGATADGAPPALVGALTLDSDEDGSLDRMRFRFSEAVVHLLGAGPFSVQGLTAQAPSAAEGSNIDVALVETPGANTSLQPLVFYVPAGPGSVTDVAGNPAPAGSASAIDGAGPVVVEGATGDSDADNRIDNVTVTMSEPVSYTGDATGPFALGVEGFTVSSVGPASGDSFTVNLVEPAQIDTGLAPDVSYASGGLLRDLAGVEAVARTYDDRTRDAVAPAFIAAETADDDGNGRLDHVDLRYSEDVQGGSSGAPFTVSGHSVTGAEFSGPRARIVIAEGGSPDTADQPSASYTPPAQVTDRVRDLPEGIGDTADEAPAQASVQAADKAGPAIVQAVTGDQAGAPDGKIDRVSLTFSEPVNHTAETTGPFSITLGGPQAVASISVATGTAITVLTTPQQQPDGGSTPDVTVIDPSKVLDAAANPAAGSAFAGTQDGVRPVLVSAKLGERDGGGACVASPPQNGILDCINATWSEPVTHPDDPSLVVVGFSIAPPIPAVIDSSLTDIPLAEGPSPNRDSSGTVAYTAPAGVPVVDAAGLEALSTNPSVLADAACANDLNEPNETRAPDSPVAGDSFGAQICAADEDWFRVAPDTASELHLMLNPENGTLLRFELWDETGGAELDSEITSASGDPVNIDLTGLVDPYYWIHIAGTSSTEEGEYCLDTRFEAGDTCFGGGGDPL